MYYWLNVTNVGNWKIHEIRCVEKMFRLSRINFLWTSSHMKCPKYSKCKTYEWELLKFNLKFNFRIYSKPQGLQTRMLDTTVMTYQVQLGITMRKISWIFSRINKYYIGKRLMGTTRTSEQNTTKELIRNLFNAEIWLFTVNYWILQKCSYCYAESEWTPVADKVGLNFHPHPL